MPALDRAALRSGTAGLLTRDDGPTGGVLSEVVELASRFSTDGSGRFVNGLLARIAREVRPGTSVEAAAPPQEALPPLEPKVDGLVIDLDGVIRYWDEAHTAASEAALGLPAGALYDAAFGEGRLTRVVDGRLSFEGWCEELGRVLADKHGTSAEDAAQVWAEQTWRLDLDVLDLVAEVREQVPVALLSNASSALVADLELSGITDAFEAIVRPAGTGVAQPAPAAFRAPAEAIGLPTERRAFVDDNAQNTEGPKRVGTPARQFTGV